MRQFTPVSLAERAKAWGASDLWIQIDLIETDQLWWELRDECRRVGLRLGIWQSLTDPMHAAWTVARYQPDSFIVEAERSLSWQELARLVPSSLPRAVVTNFAPFTTSDGKPDIEAARPLVEAGWRCLTECDLPANPHATPERMDWEARQRGWSYGQPVIYLYRGFTLESYGDLRPWPGWAAWLAETVL